MFNKTLQLTINDRKCNNKKKRTKRTNSIIENTITLAEVRAKQIPLRHERFGK